MTQVKQAYYAGFQAKCAEYGINQQETIKLAQAAEQLMSAAPVAAPAAKEEGIGRLGAYLASILPFGGALHGVATAPKDSTIGDYVAEGLKGSGAALGGGLAGGLAGGLGGLRLGALISALSKGKINPNNAKAIGTSLGAGTGAIAGAGEALHATRG